MAEHEIEREIAMRAFDMGHPRATLERVWGVLEEITARLANLEGTTERRHELYTRHYEELVGGLYGLREGTNVAYERLVKLEATVKEMQYPEAEEAGEPADRVPTPNYPGGWTHVSKLLDEYPPLSPDSMERMQNTIVEWTEQTFPKRNHQSIALHLLAEAVELARATGHSKVTVMEVVLRANEKAVATNASISEELADVAILAFDMAGYGGVKLFDLVRRKHEVNVARKWPTEPNAYGYTEHVTDPRDQHPLRTAGAVPEGLIKRLGQMQGPDVGTFGGTP
jgi:NTP pyrophosphatase (non-canonical NTP hydrolase)